MKKGQQEAVTHELDWAEVAKAAFAAKGITSGLWRVAVKLTFAGLQNGWMSPSDKSPRVLPTGLVGIEGIVLVAAEDAGPLVFDASAMTGIRAAAAKRPVSKIGRKASKG